MARIRRPDYGYSQTVFYDSSNHVSVMTQLYGSVWAKVLPHCLVNMILSAVIMILLHRYNIDLTISEFGHEFMSVIVAFLVVSKCTITLSLYFELRGSLSTMHQATVDLVQMAIAMTTTEQLNHTFQDDDPRAFEKLLHSREWRVNVAYHAMMLLRVTSAMLTRANTHGINAWEVPELRESDRMRLQQTSYAMTASTNSNSNPFLGLFRDNSTSSDKNQQTQQPPPQQQQEDEIDAEADDYDKDFESRRWMHEYATASDMNLRIPLRMAQRLRLSITSHIKKTQFALPSASPSSLALLDSVQEQQLLQKVTDFMTGYYGIRKYLTTPLPFPLVQMARIFLFFYIYTLPFALLSVVSKPLQNLVLVFIVTYGFVGVEYISIECDDPFGDDPNDLPVDGQTRSVFDDVYFSFLDADDPAGLQAIMERTRPRANKKQPQQGTGHSETSSLLV